MLLKFKNSVNLKLFIELFVPLLIKYFTTVLSSNSILSTKNFKENTNEVIALAIKITEKKIFRLKTAGDLNVFLILSPSLV